MDVTQCGITELNSYKPLLIELGKILYLLSLVLLETNCCFFFCPANRKQAPLWNICPETCLSGLRLESIPKIHIQLNDLHSIRYKEPKSAADGKKLPSCGLSSEVHCCLDSQSEEIWLFSQDARFSECGVYSICDISWARHHSSKWE